jgi:mRNA interferase RelE/StbE
MYQIESANSRIKRELRRIPRPDRMRIAEAVQALADDPRPPGVVQLEQDIHWLRVGDYRVIYKVLDEERVILIGRIVHRLEITYRNLRRLFEWKFFIGNAVRDAETVIDVREWEKRR